MSLLDLIRPQWKHSNPDVRTAAVQALSADQQDVLVTIIQTDRNPKIRQIAARKLSLLSVLRDLQQDSDPEIRQIAIQKVQEELARILRIFDGALTAEIGDMIRELRPSNLSDEVIRNARSADVRLGLVSKCNKAAMLAQVALRDADEKVSLAALENLDSEALLQDVADHSRHPSVRVKASDRLRSNAAKSAPAPSAVVQEDPTLRPKRAAVMAHAVRLLDTRNHIENEGEFNLVVAEAKSLGMDTLQGDFDQLVSDFFAKCQAQRAEIALQAQAASERLVKQQQALDLVGRLEILVNEGNADSLASELPGIRNQWNSVASEAPVDASKRYQAALLRYQRMAEQVQHIQDEKASEDRQKSIRGEILDQLKLLLTQEDLESVERQLRGLVRDWERLPLLEGEDPSMQAYNSLRSQLGQRLNDRSDAMQASFEEKMNQLRGLITRVTELDENQDFKEISRILRSTYLEWKDIVGEDKYQFHDIWKEYRAATARFEEMKEWESWRNEQEREHIIKEVDALLVLEDAPEAMGKLRHLQQAWKDAGFVPHPRLQELWDRYKASTEQIMSKFQGYIDEQNQQKQKNLEAKIAFCEEVDRINADTSDQWKDKGRRVQQLQDEWKQAGPVPREQNQPIWDRFRAACDIFYSHHKEYLAREDGERHINYEKKVVLCEKAEALSASNDWNGATNRLRNLQDEWKSVGSVPKAQSDEIWARFRTACDAFFNRKREHFDALDQEKNANFERKVALCARLEALNLDPTSPNVNETVDSIEAEWRSIGMVPKEEVDALWDRYCKITDQYLEKRASADPSIRAELDKRLAEKQTMIDKVRELCNEAGSNQASEIVRDIQDEWKQMGRSGAQEQELYHQFRKVCDDFFELRRDQLDIQEQARKNNLQRKYLLIEQAERLISSENLGEEALEEVKHLRRLWKEVGAVPREHSDKVWNRFNAACDGVFNAVRGEQPQGDRRPNR
jgi:hypothetical protein